MMDDAFQTLMEKSKLLKRSDLLQLLQMSVTVNSMLNKVINRQEKQNNSKEKGTPLSVPSDTSENKGGTGGEEHFSVFADTSDNFENKEIYEKESERSKDVENDENKVEKNVNPNVSPCGECQSDAEFGNLPQSADVDLLRSAEPYQSEQSVQQQGSKKSQTDPNVRQSDKDDWEQIARKNQLMPEGDWRIWMLLAGRGFGKTRAAAEAIRKLALSGKYKRIALIANTIEEAKQVMVEGVSGLQSISRDSDGLTYIPTRRELRWKNGTIATLYGAENYQQLRGPQFDLAWVDEFAKFLYPRETFEQLSFALRMGDDPKLILTTTPRPIPFIKELIARDDVITVRGSSLENEKNLSPTFLKHLEYLKGTRLEAQEIYAEIVEDNPNTLWSWRDIENCYRDPPHFMDNIVIGVDPAVTSGEKSDETGIIVVGKDFNDRAFVLEDASMRAAPDVWAKKIADLYQRYRANKIVVETNAGGELLDQILLRENPHLNIKKVRAKESKICRAQPVVILYQKNLVFHAKQFRELEMEMTTYEPGQKSPDRMDALVWALTDLFELEANDYVPRAFLI